MISAPVCPLEPVIRAQLDHVTVITRALLFSDGQVGNLEKRKSEAKVRPPGRQATDHDSNANDMQL